jgi:hypothetical protein
MEMAGATNSKSTMASGTETLSKKFTTPDLIQLTTTTLEKQIQEAEKQADYEDTWIPFLEGTDNPDQLIAKAELSADEAWFTLSEVRVKFEKGDPLKIRQAIIARIEKLPTDPAAKPAIIEPGLCNRVSEGRRVGFDLAEDGVHPGAFFAGE